MSNKEYQELEAELLKQRERVSKPVLVRMFIMKETDNYQIYDVVIV